MTQKRSCSSAPFASPIVESSSTGTSTSTGADGSASGGDGTAAHPRGDYKHGYGYKLEQENTRGGGW